MSKKSIDKVMSRLSENTQRTYITTIRKYEAFHGTTFEALLEEALDEQTNQVPFHLLKIKGRLEDYQDYLIDNGFVHGTIIEYVAKLKTIYKKCGVVLPYIESPNPKRTKRREYIEFKDVLTKDELKLALREMKLPAQARAMAMIQGGLSNEECEHLTTRCFIDTTRQYHQCDDDVDALQWLADENHPIIWVVKMIRQKTKKPYYAIIGAEAVNVIASAKLYEMKLPSNKGVIPNKLLTMHKGSFGRVCRNVNDKLGFGLVSEEAKLKPHNLRRFHATYLNGVALNYAEHSLITNAEIDEMQGRGKTSVQDTYIKTNPIRQKVLYAKVMNNVSLFNEYTYEIFGNDVILSRVDPDKKTQKLEEEVKILSGKLQEKEEASEKVNALRKELGDDVLLQMVEEILNAS